MFSPPFSLSSPGLWVSPSFLVFSWPWPCPGGDARGPENVPWSGFFQCFLMTSPGLWVWRKSEQRWGALLSISHKRSLMGAPHSLMFTCKRLAMAVCPVPPTPRYYLPLCLFVFGGESFSLADLDSPPGRRNIYMYFVKSFCKEYWSSLLHLFVY